LKSADKAKLNPNKETTMTLRCEFHFVAIFALAVTTPVLGQTPAPMVAPATAIPFKPATDDEGREKVEGAAEGDFVDDDDMENSLSLAAIEAELKPKVVETFDNVADAYKRLRRLQDQDIHDTPEA